MLTGTMRILKAMSNDARAGILDIRPHVTTERDYEISVRRYREAEILVSLCDVTM
jgi:hypothetical protein